MVGLLMRWIETTDVTTIWSSMIPGSVMDLWEKLRDKSSESEEQ